MMIDRSVCQFGGRGPRQLTGNEDLHRYKYEYNVVVRIEIKESTGIKTKSTIPLLLLTIEERKCFDTIVIAYPNCRPHHQGHWVHIQAAPRSEQVR